MLKLLSQEEQNALLAYYFAQSIPYRFGLVKNEPALMLKSTSCIKINKDGSVTWTAREIGVGFHSFIELVTGEKRKRRVYIPFCLVNPNSREAVKPLLETTIAPLDGRFNSKPAEFWILTPEGKGFKVRIRLESLTLHYVALQLLPTDFALKFRSKFCPFCREMEGM